MSWKVKLAMGWLGLLVAALGAILVYAMIDDLWAMAGTIGIIVGGVGMAAALMILAEWGEKRGKG